MERYHKMHKEVLSWINEIKVLIKKSLSDENIEVSMKRDHRDLVTSLDKEVENILASRIRSTYKDHLILGEEENHLLKDRDVGKIWIIDPIDGTNNFVKQRDDFCVLISYYENNEGILGYIYDVTRDDLYYAIKDEGAFCNGIEMEKPSIIQLKDGLVSTFVRLMDEKGFLKKLIDSSFDIRYYGCGGIDSIKVFQGKLAAFVNPRSGAWDLAAQIIFAREMGLKVLKFNGEPVNYLKGGDWILANKGSYEELLKITKTYSI